MYKYLIVKCEELMDAYECDCDRTPIKVCEDYTKENCASCEVYEINSDGTIGDLIKAHDEGLEKGFCVWCIKGDVCGYEHPEAVKVLEKIETNNTRKTFVNTKTFDKWYNKYVKKYALKDMFMEYGENAKENAMRAIESQGAYSVSNYENGDNEYMVGIGEYSDSRIDLGY